MSEKSPYRESGITAYHIARQAKRKPAKLQPVGYPIRGFSHSWKFDKGATLLSMRRADLPYYSRTVPITPPNEKAICRWCRKPKFIVQGHPCRGRRKRERSIV